jgi:hypothetical protein
MGGPIESGFRDLSVNQTCCKYLGVKRAAIVAVLIVTASCRGVAHTGPLPSLTPSSSVTTPPPRTDTPVRKPSGHQCRSSQVAAALGSPSGTMGQSVSDGTIRNTSSTPCSVAGYPTVLLLDARGHSLGYSSAHITSSGCSCLLAYVAPKVVDLDPGDTATFALSYQSGPVGSGTSCPRANRETIILPHTSGALTADTTLPSVCDNPYVQALHRGGTVYR